MTDIPDLLARLARTVSAANQTITVPVPDARELIALARIGHAQLTATELWAAVGRTTPQDLPVRLTPKREAALAVTQDQAMRNYQTANLALADEMLAYGQDHP